MNRVILLGRLTGDPVIRYTKANKAVAQFTLAVDRPAAGADGKRETDFIPIVMWGKQAELVGNSCGKGHRLLVDGRLQIRNYTAQDGTKRYVTEVVAGGFDFIERREKTHTYGVSEPGLYQIIPPGAGEAQPVPGLDELGEEVPF